MQAHLRLHAWAGFREEVCGAHPRLQRPEHMLNRAAPLSHLAGAGIQATLHGLQYGLMLPAPDAALPFRGCAPRLDGALHARTQAVIGVDDQPLLDRLMMAWQELTGRAAVHILICLIALDAFLNLLDALLQFVRREVLVPVIHGLELAAIDGHHGMAEQVQLAAQGDELLAGVANAGAVVAAEIGNGLEVGRQVPSEPHDFNVALGLPLQPAARLHPIQIAVDVQLEQ